MGLLWGILWGNLPQLMGGLQTWALLATAMNPRPVSTTSVVLGRDPALLLHSHSHTHFTWEKITPWKQAGLMEWV